jgi:hypothetical protein
MGRKYVSPNRSDARDGAMIGILAVVVGLALVATLAWAFVFGGLEPPRGQAGLYAPVPATGAPGEGG